MSELRCGNRDGGVFVRILAAAGATFLLNVCAWEFTAGVAPLAGIYLLIIVPLTPIPVMLCLGFVEHRLHSLLVLSAVSAMTGVFVAWLYLGSLGEPEMAYFVVYIVPIYLLGMWWFGMVGAGVGVVVSRVVLKRRKIPDGMCKHCGYNLTGNVSGVCPECGTAINMDADE